MLTLAFILMGIVIGFGVSVLVFIITAIKYADATVILNYTDLSKDPILFQFHIPITKIGKRELLFCRVVKR